MKIALAADHGGLPLKAEIAELVKSLGYEVLDLGAHQFDKDDDYPDFARYIGQAIQHGQAERGILLCGSGVGASIAANKMKGVRAAVCHDAYSAAQGVEHDDMNVLCMGSRIIGGAVADVLVRSFLSASFLAQGKYQRRLDKVLGIEAGG